MLGGEAYTPSSPVAAAELVVQRAASGDVYRLQLETALHGPCMRCLVPAVAPIAVDAREYEASDPAAGEELRTEYVRDGELDLARWARDAIADELSDQILCRPDCLGLCPVCGVDLNLEPHEHEVSTTDPRWSALEALRDE